MPRRAARSSSSDAGQADQEPRHCPRAAEAGLFVTAFLVRSPFAKRRRPAFTDSTCTDPAYGACGPLRCRPGRPASQSGEGRLQDERSVAVNCRHCGSALHHVFLDLGFAPPSNAYLTKA
ncbi:MAG TPA: hypothetical protein VKD22_12620, partial [Ramlibacter sp.]|nr:hypothetical protein [Ramlibacter sp.]